jgi:hypothetical protein
MERTGLESLLWEADFSTSVARARVAAGLSHADLAQRVRAYGLSLNAWDVQELESGERPVRLNDALILRMVLTVELPEVTEPDHQQLVTAAYSQSFAKVEKEWDGIVEDLARRRPKVLGTLQKAMYVRSTYEKAMSLAEGECDRELVKSLKELIQEVLAVIEGLADMDSHLGGGLSRPSTEAPLPGSQT